MIYVDSTGTGYAYMEGDVNPVAVKPVNLKGRQTTGAN